MASVWELPFEATWAPCSILMCVGVMNLASGTRPRGRALTLVPQRRLALICAPFTGPAAGTLAMCSPEESALLRLEEVFSATLARINSLVLQPLLAAGEPRFSTGKDGGRRSCPGTGVLPCWALRATAFSPSNASADTWCQPLGSRPPDADCSFLRGTLRSQATNPVLTKTCLCMKTSFYFSQGSGGILWLNSHLELPQGTTRRQDAWVLLPA